MLAFLTRRKETPVPDTTTTETSTTQTDDNVLMRFLTQGGATVELHHQDKRVRTMPHSSVTVMPDGETRMSHGYNWRCLGCGAIGGGGRYGMGDNHFDQHQLGEARDEANSHATTCRAMPKPAA